MQPGLGQGLPLLRFVTCRCPSCGYVIEHRRNIPCNEIRCPKCNVPLIGE